MTPMHAGDMSQTRECVELRELVLPLLANHHGTLFAGQGLQMMAKAAFLVAREFAQQEVVMASVTGVEFLAPIPIGTQLILRARVTRVGRSSMSVHVIGLANGLGDPPMVALEGTFEMVAVDDSGSPIAISSEDHQQLPARSA